MLIVRDTAAGRLESVTGGIVVDRPPQAVYDTLVDYPNYPKFMPNVAECNIVADRGDEKDVHYKVKIKVGISFEIEYTLRKRYRAPEEISWTLLSSKGNKLKKSDGFWRLMPLDGGKRTAAFYSTKFDIADVVWGFERILKREPSMEVAINAGTGILIIKAIKCRSENPHWTGAGA